MSSFDPTDGLPDSAYAVTPVDGVIPPGDAASSMSGWDAFIQKIGAQVVTANLAQPFELQKMQIQAKSQNGTTYREGQPGALPNGTASKNGMVMVVLAVGVLGCFWLLTRKG